jgi:hypothetical protein
MWFRFIDAYNKDWRVSIVFTALLGATIGVIVDMWTFLIGWILAFSVFTLVVLFLIDWYVQRKWKREDIEHAAHMRKIRNTP